MKSLVVPKVDIDGASLDEVVEYIRGKAKALSGGGTPPNIILRGRDIGDREVTLRLSNVPLSEVLRYAGDLAGVRFSYEKHAIIGYDKRPEPAIAKEEGDPASGDSGTEVESPRDEFPAVIGFIGG